MISEIVHVTDPVAYVSSLLMIVIACLFAAWIPASRAAQVDPMKNAGAGVAIPAPAALFLRPADRGDHAVDAVRGHQFAVVFALVFEPAKQLRPRLRFDE